MLGNLLPAVQNHNCLDFTQSRAFCRILSHRSFDGRPNFIIWMSYSAAMQGEKGERWRKLCEQAAVEKDPQKLMELVSQITQMLDEKQQRLSQQTDDQ